MKLNFTWVTIPLLSVLLAGCSDEVRIENPAATTPAESQTQAQDQPSPEGEEPVAEPTISLGGIGDTLTGSVTRITLNSVSFAKPNQFLEPEYGKFVVLNFTIENTSDEPVSISSFGSFELQGSDLYVYSQAFGVETRGSLDSTIAPGSSLRGEIAFDVPQIEGFEVRFKEALFNEVAAKFEFKFSEISN